MRKHCRYKKGMFIYDTNNVINVNKYNDRLVINNENKYCSHGESLLTN